MRELNIAESADSPLGALAGVDVRRDNAKADKARGSDNSGFIEWLLD